MWASMMTSLACEKAEHGPHPQPGCRGGVPGCKEGAEKAKSIKKNMTGFLWSIYPQGQNFLTWLKNKKSSQKPGSLKNGGEKETMRIPTLQGAATALWSSKGLHEKQMEQGLNSHRETAVSICSVSQREQEQGNTQIWAGSLPFP